MKRRFPRLLTLAGLAALAWSGGGFADEPTADLRATISGPRDGEIGQTLVYSITARNDGPGVAADVVIGVQVPHNLFTVIGSTLSKGGCTGVEHCPVGFLAPGETVTGTVSVQPRAKQPSAIGVSVASATADPDRSNDASSTPVFTPGPPIPSPRPPISPRAPGPPRPVVGSDRLPPGIVGRPYSATIPITSAAPPYSVRLTGQSGPPPGLTLSESGVLSGVPQQPSWSWISIVVSDGGRNPTPANLLLRVVAPLEIKKPPIASTGAPYSAEFVTGGAAPYRVTFVSGSLPPGLNEAYGFSRLQGRARLSGPFAFTVSVTDSLGLVTQAAVELRVQVGPGASLLANPALTPGAVKSRGAQCASKRSGVRPTLAAGVRSRLLRAYGVWWRPKNYVIDHLIPVELGGHPTNLRNLWPQLAEVASGTDVVERTILRKTCRGVIRLDEARKLITQRKYRTG